jgi:outer membrane protein TolC
MLKNMEVIRNYKRWAAMLSLAALVGCAVGPRYQGPPNLGLHDYHAVRAVAAPVPADAAAVTLDSWWLGFNDPLLTRIVERALSQNLDLAAALARVDQARAAAKEAGAQLLPAGALDTSVNQLHQSLTGPIGAIAHDLPGYQRNQTLYDASVGAGWERRLRSRSASRSGFRWLPRPPMPTSECAAIRRVL